MAVAFWHQFNWVFVDESGGLRDPGAVEAFLFLKKIHIHLFGMALPVVAGTTFILMMRSPSFAGRTLIVRAGGLCALGYLMNYLTWGIAWPADTFAWDILQLIALSMAVTYPVWKYLPRRAAYAVLLMLGGLSLALSRHFPFEQYAQAYPYIMFFGDPKGAHYWPFFPWYSHFVAGVFLSDLFSGEKRIPRAVFYLAGVTCLLLYFQYMHGTKAFFGPDYDFHRLWGTVVFKPDVRFLLGNIGLALAAIPLTQSLLEKNEALRRLMARSVFIPIGAGVLWVYLIMTVVGYHATSWMMEAFQPTYSQAVRILPLTILAHWAAGYFIGRVVLGRKRIEYL